MYHIKTDNTYFICYPAAKQFDGIQMNNYSVL